MKTTRYRFIEGDATEPTMYVERRGKGAQTVVPPSTHPEGEQYTWDAGTKPAMVDTAQLLADVARVATCALLARHWPGQGSRDEAALALAGMLLRAGWAEEDSDRFTCTAARAAGDEEWQDRAKATQTARSLREGKPVTGAPSLANLLRDGERVVKQAQTWLGIKQSPDQSKMPNDAMLPSHSPKETTGALVRGGHLSTVKMSDVEPEAVQWLWRGYIPLGKVTVLDGDPGLGKSLLTLDLTARVTTGAVMPDGTPGIAVANAILLSAEDDLADTIRPRLDCAGADASRVVALEAVGDVDTDTGEIHERDVYLPGDLTALKRVIDEQQARLVVIDPLMAYLDGDVNAHRDQDVRRALRPLTQIAQETGAAIVVIRHLTKMPGGKAIYRGGGSIGIAGAARSALLVGEDPDDENKRVLARVKSNLASPVPALSYCVVEDQPGVPKINWLGPTEHTATTILAVPADPEWHSATEECMEWLQDLLEEHGGWMPAKEAQHAARSAGHSDKVLRQARERLCGKPTKEGFGGEGQWVWRLKSTNPSGEPKMPTDMKMPNTDHTRRMGTIDDAGHLSREPPTNCTDPEHHQDCWHEVKGLGWYCVAHACVTPSGKAG